MLDNCFFKNAGFSLFHQDQGEKMKTRRKLWSYSTETLVMLDNCFFKNAGFSLFHQDQGKKTKNSTETWVMLDNCFFKNAGFSLFHQDQGEKKAIPRKLWSCWTTVSLKTQVFPYFIRKGFCQKLGKKVILQKVGPPNFQIFFQIFLSQGFLMQF